MRWQHPRLGLLSPAAFLELAETGDLIFPLGEWVLQEGIRQAQRWHAAGFSDITLAVNVLPRQLQQPELADLIRSTLRSVNYDPNFLELEMTETTAISQLKIGQHSILDLTDAGVSISLDDFGTGYSSLARLKQLPLHKLKIGSLSTHRS